MFSSVMAGAMSVVARFWFRTVLALVLVLVLVEMWRRSRAEEVEAFGACLRGGRVEPGGRRGMGIRANFSGRGVWLVRTTVKVKMRPRGTVGGMVMDSVRPGRVGVRDGGRLSFGGVGGREDGGMAVLVVEGTGMLLNRLGR